MSDLKIVTVPDPILKKQCKRVENAQGAFVGSREHMAPQYKSWAELGQKMLKFMEASKGVGLAAPQVGLDLQLFVASPTGKAKDGKLYINPMFMGLEGEQLGDEGCLSIPNVRAPIRRYQRACISYLCEDRGLVYEEADGWLARIWQHETDHLYGILITDRYNQQNPLEGEYFMPQGFWVPDGSKT